MNEYQELAIRALNQMRGNNVDSSEIEAAIDWVEQQDEEDFEDYEDDLAPDLLPIPTYSAMYASGVRALCQGGANRAILLKEDYEFDKHHTLEDVQSFELQGGGYPPGGVPVAFQPINETTAGLDKIRFTDVTGDIHGCVVLNEYGLIIYLSVTAHCDGGDLTITSG